MASESAAMTDETVSTLGKRKVEEIKTEIDENLEKSADNGPKIAKKVEEVKTEASEDIGVPVGRSEEPPAKKAKVSDPALLAKILKQVEFYFSDSNLPRDKFLLGETKKDDGWIPLATIGSFSRMRQMTTDLTVVTEAVRGSACLLALSEDGLKVRRSTPLPTKEELEAAKAKKAFFAGVPRTSTLEGLTEFFSKFGSVQAIRMFRSRKGGKEMKFTGCGLVEFATVEEASKVVENPPTMEEHQIKMKTHAVWIKENEERRSSGPKKSAENSATAENAPKEEEKEAVKVENVGDRAITVKNIVFSLGKLKEDVNFRELKDSLNTLLPSQGDYPSIAYVSIKKADGAAQAFVRLGTGYSGTNAEAIQALRDAEFKVGEVVPEMEILTGEAEEKYWEENLRQRAEFQARRGPKRGGRGRGGRGGRRGGRGRRF
eukprot:277023_1